MKLLGEPRNGRAQVPVGAVVGFVQQEISTGKGYAGWPCKRNALAKERNMVKKVTPLLNSEGRKREGRERGENHPTPKMNYSPGFYIA